MTDKKQEPCDYGAIGSALMSVCLAAAVEELERMQLELAAWRALGSLDHLRELAQAEKDGRLVVLPFTPKKMVWVNAPHLPAPYKCFYADAPAILMDAERGYTFGETREEAEAALEGGAE